jgi:hypothetical protein
MGHGSLQVASIYTHRVSEADRAAAQHMGALLGDGEIEPGKLKPHPSDRPA